MGTVPIIGRKKWSTSLIVGKPPSAEQLNLIENRLDQEIVAIVATPIQNGGVQTVGFMVYSRGPEIAKVPDQPPRPSSRSSSSSKSKAT